jgi:hypothetical protein
MNPVVVSQFRSLYRYGGMAHCKPKLEDMKFCFSLRSLSPEEKRDAWLTRRAEWWAERRMNGSSEDVWEVRGCVIKVHCDRTSTDESI